MFVMEKCCVLFVIRTEFLNNIQTSFVCFLVGWLAGWLAGWLVGWLAGWLAGWLVGWLVVWFGVK
jgi:hypothetical protein